MSLASFPEELVEHILADAVIASPAPSLRASWHTPLDLRTRVAPLLVSSSFHRIAVPLFYHTVVIHTPGQSKALLQALHKQPSLARSVRRLVLLAPAETDIEILQLLAHVHYLDITLPLEDREFGLAGALHGLHNLEELVIRKGAATYLSQRGPRAVLDALAGVITSCPKLDSVTIAFPLSADHSLSPLVDALTSASSLTTLRTPVPSFWSPTLLNISSNPALQALCLGDDLSGKSAEHRRPVMASSLFLSAARQHGRLSDLIRAGTSVVGWRSRAWTMGSVDLGNPPAVNAEARFDSSC
ncbi:hypothetical protein MIND_00612600 [Mycena indigotica]|uniref:Uncharacterized protein n=1 Tax=Mycena indigotica TaxID=2126181 RepID=A0A8H6W6W0_9AGAR|nr:uncharacterized protein MIND_00612600 [Mycena indigotica]KAF7303828.1 hypothetical protein MIND_00612600 [Mycena indigotica]